MSDLPSKYNAVFSALQGVKQQPDDWIANCPAHDDNDASLHLKEGHDGKLILHCHSNSGCEFEDIRKALGLEFKDFFPPNSQPSNTSRPKNTNYSYRDENNKVLYQTIRKVPKDFYQRRPARDDENCPSEKIKHGWVYTLRLDWDAEKKGWKAEPMVRRVPYRLPELLKADKSRWVLVVEGEKQADRLAKMGFITTTNVGGAGKWLDEYGTILSGRNVCVLPDNDPQAKEKSGELRFHKDGRPVRAGWDHAVDVAKNCRACNCKVRILELPGLDDKEDSDNWLDRGGTVDELKKLIGDCPDWEGELRSARDRGESKIPPAGVNDDRIVRPTCERSIYLNLADAIKQRESIDDPDFLYICRGLIADAVKEAKDVD